MKVFSTGILQEELQIIMVECFWPIPARIATATLANGAQG